jgi:hypothetical protein
VVATVGNVPLSVRSVTSFPPFHTVDAVQEIPTENLNRRRQRSFVSTLTQIRESVLGLSMPERAELAVFLLGSLDEAHYWIRDEEVTNRSAELDSGAVVGVTKEEFKRLCEG